MSFNKIWFRYFLPHKYRFPTMTKFLNTSRDDLVSILPNEAATLSRREEFLIQFHFEQIPFSEGLERGLFRKVLVASLTLRKNLSNSSYNSYLTAHSTVFSLQSKVSLSVEGTQNGVASPNISKTFGIPAKLLNVPDPKLTWPILCYQNMLYLLSRCGNLCYSSGVSRIKNGSKLVPQFTFFSQGSLIYFMPTFPFSLD